MSVVGVVVVFGFFAFDRVFGFFVFVGFGGFLVSGKEGVFFVFLLIKDGLIHQKGCYSGSPLLNWPLSWTRG